MMQELAISIHILVTCTFQVVDSRTDYNSIHRSSLWISLQGIRTDEDKSSSNTIRHSWISITVKSTSYERATL
jgi:hypothetical protein